MELTHITAAPAAGGRLRTADVPGRREVHITLEYGEEDLEAAADAAGLDLGAAERDSMLLLLDDAITDLVHSGIRAALGEAISAEVQACARGAACTEDD